MVSDFKSMSYWYDNKLIMVSFSNTSRLNSIGTDFDPLRHGFDLISSVKSTFINHTSIITALIGDIV